MLYLYFVWMRYKLEVNITRQSLYIQKIDIKENATDMLTKLLQQRSLSIVWTWWMFVCGKPLLENQQEGDDSLESLMVKCNSSQGGDY